MDIVDIAIHPVVCQKFQNSQKLDPLQIPGKNSCQNMPAFQRYFGARR
jgi:hypothetical protein